MKIADARKAYTLQISQQRSLRKELTGQQEKLQKQMEKDAERGVTLELSEEYQKRAGELQKQIETLSALIEQNEEKRDEIIEQETGIANAESSKQQADALKKWGEDMAKCLEIARRISNGDKVPPQDEKKLMDYNMEIYMAAKNMAVMNMDKEHKEYDSLWEDEEEQTSSESPTEIAANTEISVEQPAEYTENA